MDKEYKSLCSPLFQSVMGQALLVGLGMFTALALPHPRYWVGAGSMTHCLLSQELGLSELKLFPKNSLLSVCQPSFPLRTENTFCDFADALFHWCRHLRGLGRNGHQKSQFSIQRDFFFLSSYNFKASRCLKSISDINRVSGKMQ